jgi:putative phosphoesterase
LTKSNLHPPTHEILQPATCNLQLSTMHIGVISDTHGFLDPQIPKLFAGVDHILHGGDIGQPWLILELEQIAPVTAVLGNTDTDLNFNETEAVRLGGRKFLVHHIVDVRAPAETIRQRILRENPDVVIFGHTHKPCNQTIGKTLYLNPGYAGKQRFDLGRSVAILHCDGAGIRAEFRKL